jgi:AraC-like DNA-binding protein
VQVAQRVDLRTRSPSAARRALESAFGSIDFDGIDLDQFEIGIRAVAIPGLSVTHVALDFAGVARAEVADGRIDRQMIAVGRVTGGRCRIGSEGRDVDTSGPFLFPPRFETRFARARWTVTAVGYIRARDHARRAVADDRLRLAFTGTAPLSAALAEQWLATQRYADEVLALLARGATAPLVEHALGEQVVAALLQTFPNTALGGLADADRDDRRGTTATLRRATTFIDEHLAEPIGLAEVAAASGLSARGLQSAFRRQLGMAPMEYLRRARLAACRDELRTSDPADATVAVIARRWGFVHLGRFAQAYREHFGEPPSRTLQG